MAAIFFLEMAAGHFKQWQTSRELWEVLHNHPNFKLLEGLRPEAVSEKQYRNKQLLLKKPRMFELKYRIIGLVEGTARLILRIPFVRKMRNVRRFPLRNLPK